MNIDRALEIVRAKDRRVPVPPDPHPEGATLWNVPPGYSGDKCPVGYRATWENRSKLATAKLAPKINQDTTNGDFPSILLAEDTTNAGDDDFVEVHTYGPLHQRAIQHVNGPEPARRADRALWKQVKRKLTSLGASWNEV